MTRDMEVFSGRTEAGGDPLSSGVADGLVVVSNRQPYRHHYESDEGDDIAVERPMGGLTAGLDPVMKRLGGTWIAWGDGDADYAVTDENDCVEVPPDDPAYTLQRVRLSEEEVRGYYDGYANQMLWPLCHSAPDKISFEETYWDCYSEVNERFAGVVLEHADASSTVWFQDYHFALAPRAVRSELPGAFLMQFWHIPWPEPGVFRACPQRGELLSGLLGNDLLGFHVPRYCANFLRCVEEHFADATTDWDAGRVHYDGHATTVRSFPLGVDADELRQRATSMDESFWTDFKRDHGIAPDTRVALGVDRLDYTKGIPQRLAALEHLWETTPEWRGAFTYVQKGSPSRERIPAYQHLQTEVEEAVERVNDRFGTDEWQPVVYTTEQYPQDELAGLYRYSDVALVSPLRDGMNLVAQEYVASQVDDDGVLVLSELAGAHDEFGGDVLTVNPFDTPGYAATIEQALRIDDDECTQRMHALRRQVHANDLSHWLDDVFGTARRIASEAEAEGEEKGESTVEAQ